jgi:hypothetical protein
MKLDPSTSGNLILAPRISAAPNSHRRLLAGLNRSIAGRPQVGPNLLAAGHYSGSASGAQGYAGAGHGGWVGRFVLESFPQSSCPQRYRPRL